MLNEEVRNIMTTNPFVVHPNDRIQNVIQEMSQRQLQQIPVVDDGKLAGMVTTYDLWSKYSAQDDKGSMQIKDIMTTRVIHIAPKDKVGTAAELFIDKRFKTLPVVNLTNELKDVITAFDVIKYVMKKEYPTAILYKEVLEG